MKHAHAQPQTARPAAQKDPECRYHPGQPMMLDYNGIPFCRPCRSEVRFVGISETERRLRHTVSIGHATISSEDKTR